MSGRRQIFVETGGVCSFLDDPTDRTGADPIASGMVPPEDTGETRTWFRHAGVGLASGRSELCINGSIYAFDFVEEWSDPFNLSGPGNRNFPGLIRSGDRI